MFLTVRIITEILFVLSSVPVAEAPGIRARGCRGSWEGAPRCRFLRALPLQFIGSIVSVAALKICEVMQC